MLVLGYEIYKNFQAEVQNKFHEKLEIFFNIGKYTIINLQFSMPFVAEMDIESSSSGYERH